MQAGRYIDVAEKNSAHFYSQYFPGIYRYLPVFTAYQESRFSWQTNSATIKNEFLLTLRF